jgi:hypothetical protein
MGGIPINFNPNNERPVHIHNLTNLNIDGRLLAQAVSDRLEDLYSHPTDG